MVEAHLHGRVDIGRDLSTLTLDPSYRGTPTEAMARRLPCRLRWHSGFRVATDVVIDNPSYRGPEIVAAAIEMAGDGDLTPRLLGEVRRRRDYDLQTVKRVWHYTARFGRRDPALVLGEDDPQRADVAQLRTVHHDFARAVTPAGHVHAMDPAAPPDPSVVLHSARGDGDMLLAIGALRRLDARHGELKSMHTVQTARGSGVGRTMLDHLLAEARAADMSRVSLETGTMDSFGPARAMYHAAGFVECEPFGDYTVNPHSVCMTRTL